MPEHSVVFRTPPDGVDVVHAALESLWLQETTVDEMDRMMFETALIELVSNVIQHGASPTTTLCELALTADDADLTAVLVDSAPQPHIDFSPREMPDEFAESGRGLAFIQALVDDFDYRRKDDRNIWAINKHRAVTTQ